MGEQIPSPSSPIRTFSWSSPSLPTPILCVPLRHPILALDSPSLQLSSLFLQDLASAFLLKQLISLLVGWFSFPRTCPVFPEGFSFPLFPQIQQQWMLYTIRLDHMMEDALRLNVKWSLLELSKAINGDGKTTPNPLFRVLVILKNDLQGGVAQVGRNHFAPNILKPSHFVSFR